MFLSGSFVGNESSNSDCDPELEALLAFAPVPRRVERENGWSADNQRAFIAGLVETGNYRIAAQRLDLTASGVYQLRKDAGAEDFARAWDEALALYRARKPARGSAPPTRGAGPGVRSGGRADLIPGDEGGPSAKVFVLALLQKYWIKLDQERTARLEGRIVEADFYVRQLSWFEVLIDLGEAGMEAMDRLKRGDVRASRIVATPMSVLLETTRRAYWREKGEPERPTLASLGLPTGEDYTTGAPSHREYRRERDGDEKEWRRREDKKAALAAQAQAAWEEKARKDAADWRGRTEGDAG